MEKSFIVVILLLAITGKGWTQRLPFRSYSIEKGLSEAVVNDLMQDDDGYLWIATGYGLNRFDGIHFKNYYSENGLLNNKIYSLFQDKSGDIWIGTGGGVNVMREDSIRTIPELKPLETSIILDIFQDTHGDYWFATDGQGIWNYDRTGNLTQYLSVHGLADDRVRSIIEDEEGTLWFATNGGLTSLKEGNFRSYTSKNGLPDNNVDDLLEGENGNIWIGTRGGLCLFKKGQFTSFTEKDGLISNRIQSLAMDEKGYLWIGTESGASYFANGVFKNYSAEQGLSNNIIYATLFDREHNIWFGTFGGGISVFFGDQFKSYTVEEGLPNNVITSIVQDKHDNHWITTYGGGIIRFDGTSFHTFNEKDGLVDNKVYSSIFDSKGRLIIGTLWGLSIFDGNYFKNFNEQELPYRKIRAVLEDKADNSYWLGTYGEGVIRYKNDTFKLLTEQDGLASNTVLAEEEGDDGSIWFATYGGVSRYKNGVFTNYTIQDGLPNNGILDILKDREGTLWVSTFGGIAKFNGDGTFSAVTSQDGLQDDVCYFIIQDNNGIYWIGTNKGVIRFDYAKFKNSNEDDDHSLAFKLLTQDQGLVANEMNAGARYKDKRGYLWFGSVGGLTEFDPDREKINNAPPKVHIQYVNVSGEVVEHASGLEVSSNNHNITFGYVGINFTAPEQVKYEYRLRGSGEEWQRTMQRSVRYSTLLPGEYTFEVKAQNSDGLWSTSVSSLKFSVMAPFWLQWWFILLVVVFLVGTVLFVYNYYRVHKMVEIERMRVRIASDLHDDVGSALTEIALQSDFLQTTEVDSELKKTLNQMGTQSRRIVSSLDDIVWSIDARNDTLGDLTDRMQDYANNVLPQKEVIYEFEDLNMEEKLTVQMKENLYLIFKEAINNIAKHSDATRVDVKLNNDNNAFNMVIHDNGTGVRSARKTGHGLRNMKMRANRIDANVYFKNETGFTVHVFGKGL